MNEETVFHHHSKRNQLLILSTLFCYYYCCTFSCFFFKWLFFPSKQIKIMFKVFKLILNINIRRESVFTSYRIVLWNGTKTYTIWCKFDQINLTVVLAAIIITRREFWVVLWFLRKRVRRIVCKGIALRIYFAYDH